REHPGADRGRPRPGDARSRPAHVLRGIPLRSLRLCLGHRLRPLPGDPCVHRRQHAARSLHGGIGMRARLSQSVLIAALLALLALSLVPFAIMLVMSLKSNAQIFAHFWQVPAPPRWDFYARAWS